MSDNKEVPDENENEFYDACDSLDKLRLNDQQEKEEIQNYDTDDEDDDFQSMMPNYKEFESKEFLSRHENLTKVNEESAQDKEKFIPLHERLNNEIKENQEIYEEDEEETNELVESVDPFYVDETELEKQMESLSETEKEEKLQVARTHKDAGNVFFKEEKYIEALEEYTKALRSCPLDFNKERAIFYSNRSICYFKMKEDDKCIKECTKSIELNPEFTKPLLRRAECNQTADKLEEVLNDYKKLCELEPFNKNYKRKCYELEEAIKARNEKLKEEMMGKLKELGNMCLKPFGLSTNNFQFVQDPNTGSYSVNFKQN